jgi:hypothetical protein
MANGGSFPVASRKGVGMRSLRSWVGLVGLCLFLGAPVASAAEAPSAAVGQEVSGMARILGHLQAFLKAVWENEGCDIDPLGRCSPGTTGEEPGAPSADEGWQIDPWG